ncbi:MAG: permease [Betaproteobacteria bacterium]|nr:permease [Betaproteobacteria bacterium]
MFETLADLLVYRMGGLSPDDRLGAALHFFVMDVTKILVLLTLVIYVMGLLRALLKPETVRAFIRNRGNLQSRFLAVGLGAVTPFCSCSSIPLFIGFVEAGIPLGVTLSFLIASPMINEVAVVVLASVIGWKFTVLYVVTGLAVALIGGFVLERFRPERWVEDYVWKIHMGEAAQVEEDKSVRARHDYALSQVKEIVGRIWKFILVGVGVGAFIHGYVPADFVARVAGDGSVLSVVGAVLIGVPLYSDAVGIIPIAEVLLGKGVPIGTVLAFMMAVTALSLPEMIILKKVAKVPLLALFSAYLATAFIIVGLLFNSLKGVL